jgi:hypothetical protein
MNDGFQIQYISNRDIDKTKWDKCIDEVPNGLIYAYSFYLDCMAKQWDALVLNDYEGVMPLTWNKKYGFYYLYQPAFTALLGIFGKNISQELVTGFLKTIPSEFRLIEISLNAGNNYPAASADFTTRVNYTLELNKDYTSLYNAFRDNHKRDIAKAIQSGCLAKKDLSVEEVIQLNKEQTGFISNAKPDDYSNFKNVYELLKRNNKAKVYGITDSQNKVLASAVFFFSHNRAYYIMVGNHPDGKSIGASHALIDAFIKDHAGQNLVLDFEGSDIKNLAFFYSGFGAKEELYPFLKINKLPLYLKWMKR